MKNKEWAIIEIIIDLEEDKRGRKMNLEYLDPIANLLGEWSVGLNTSSILFRIILTVILGAIVGMERSSKRHAAGFRTFILVSLSTTVAMMLDIALAESEKVSPVVSAAAIVGIAIISINSILYSSKNQIRGLTTAVGLFTWGIMGLCIGAGLYSISLIAFAAFICSLTFFPRFEMYLKNRSNHFEVHIELKSPTYLQDLVTVMRKLGLRIDDIELNPAYASSGLSVYSIAVSIESEELKKYKTHEEIIKAMSTLDYMCHIEEMK